VNSMHSCSRPGTPSYSVGGRPLDVRSVLFFAGLLTSRLGAQAPTEVLTPPPIPRVRLTPPGPLLSLTPLPIHWRRDTSRTSPPGGTSVPADQAVLIIDGRVVCPVPGQSHLSRDVIPPTDSIYEIEILKRNSAVAYPRCSAPVAGVVTITTYAAHRRQRRGGRATSLDAT
jgi:hypothetical protein